MPGETTLTRSGLNPRSCTISRLLDSDNVTIDVRWYTGGATVDSTKLPNEARRGGSVICHISACTWCSHVTCAVRDHSGEKNGIPFQISTRPSRPPCHPIISLNAARGNTR